MTDAELIADRIIKGIESDSGTVLGIGWIHRQSLMQLMTLAAQDGLDRNYVPAGDEEAEKAAV